MDEAIGGGEGVVNGIGFGDGDAGHVRVVDKVDSVFAELVEEVGGGIELRIQ
ncbi:hypothetical protein [Rhodococcus sp. OK302]|uniref:hypothetical protein n=1 Tax=Rhodococcus sp. OK302 TaxID=1882769 RepID=UPI0020CD8444|nr:hypothetical protein [Rhodococcus sp. OK302]